MMDRAGHEPQIDLRPASLDQKPIVANLLQLYVHDFSEFIACPIGPDGRFGYTDLDLYWTDPQRFPFLIYVDQELAGFLLVQGIPRADTALWDMSEFFILRGYRRRSIGNRAACEAFARFPGSWQVRVMESNAPACAFWNRAVRAFAGQAVARDQASAGGRRWNLFSFHSPPAEEVHPG